MFAEEFDAAWDEEKMGRCGVARDSESGGCGAVGLGAGGREGLIESGHLCRWLFEESWSSPEAPNPAYALPTLA